MRRTLSMILIACALQAGTAAADPYYCVPIDPIAVETPPTPSTNDDPPSTQPNTIIELPDPSTGGVPWKCYLVGNSCEADYDVFHGRLSMQYRIPDVWAWSWQNSAAAAAAMFTAGRDVHYVSDAYRSPNVIAPWAHNSKYESSRYVYHGSKPGYDDIRRGDRISLQWSSIAPNGAGVIGNYTCDVA